MLRSLTLVDFEKLNWFAYNLQIYIFVLFVPGGSMQVAQKYFRLVTKENSWWLNFVSGSRSRFMVKLPSPPQTATLYNLTRIVFKFINSPKLLRQTLVSTVLFLISNFKKMNNDRVDDHCYSFVRFNDVGSSMTPSFLLMDHFHYRFST